MNTTEANTIARIVKVNHAGEHGAIRIYKAQLYLARHFYEDLVPFLEKTLSHEQVHCVRFQSAMPERGARPCRTMSLWSSGGYILGFATAAFGRQAVMICTEAVESTVHRHLGDQLSYLETRDQELYDIINAIRSEEIAHRDYATSRITSRTLSKRLLASLIVAATEIVIWLSTWGDSARLRQDLERLNAPQ